MAGGWDGTAWKLMGKLWVYLWQPGFHDTIGILPPAALPIPSTLLPPLTPCGDITSCVAQVPGTSQLGMRPLFPLCSAITSSLSLPFFSSPQCLSSNQTPHSNGTAPREDKKEKKNPGFEFQFQQLGALRSLVSYGASVSLRNRSRA